MQNSKNSDLHNSNQKLVLHMWEDEHHDQQQNENRKHRDHKHHHRNRHKHHSSRDHHKDHISENDRIDVYVAKRNLKGPPTKPKPNMVEYARKTHSALHSKHPFLSHLHGV